MAIKAVQSELLCIPNSTSMAYPARRELGWENFVSAEVLGWAVARIPPEYGIHITLKGYQCIRFPQMRNSGKYG